MKASRSSIVLFDGVCHLCQGWVRFLLPRDRRGRFQFAALQSPAGQRLLRRNGLASQSMESLVLLEGSQCHQRSTAVLKALKALGGVWSFFYPMILIPRPWRDGVYDLIARNRYWVFGKDDRCLVPTREMKERFLK